MTFILTRLLYSRDEVFHSLTNSILEGKDIYECYFWIGEIYYSDPKDSWEIFKYIWGLFFDFYAVQNPSLEKYIQKKEQLWKKKREINTLIYIIHNMFISSASDDVFIIRNYINQHDNDLVLYRVKGRKWKWLESIKNIYHQFLISLKKKNIVNACLQLRHLNNICDPKELYMIILTYYSKDVILQDQNIINKRWMTRCWPNQLQAFIALIMHLETPLENIKHPFIFHQPCIRIKEGMYLHNKNIENRHTNGERVYNILKDSRIYDIHLLNGVFVLDREKMGDFKKENRYYWEYYAHKCPLWKGRMDKYSYKFSEKTLEIKDEFYDHYNMELDEQSTLTQNKSIKDVTYITINEWHNQLFADNPIIELHTRSNDCKYS